MFLYILNNHLLYDDVSGGKKQGEVQETSPTIRICYTSYNSGICNVFDSMDHLKQEIMLGYVLFLISILVGSNIGDKVNKDGMHNMCEGAIVSFSTLLGVMCIILLNEP